MRISTTLAALLALAVLTAGCTANATSEPASAPVVDPVVAAAERASGLPQRSAAVKVTVADEIRGETTRIVTGAGVQTARTSTTARVRPDAATLTTAVDAAGNVTARALTLRVAGLPARDLALDYTSTAFTRLITSTYLTSDPLSLLLIRSVAQESPHLAELAQAMQTNAAENPKWESQPTEDEIRALTRLGDDVAQRLRAFAQRLSPGAARVAPAWAMPATGSDLSPCQDPLAQLSGPANAPTRVCLAPVRDGYTGLGKPNARGYVQVEAENSGGAWAMVYGQKSRSPLALIPPRVIHVPGIEEVAGALAMSAAKGAASTAGRAVANASCGVASFFGSDCEPKQIDPGEIFDGMIDDFVESIDVDKAGTATFFVSSYAAADPLFVVTAGWARDDAYRKTAPDSPLSRSGMVRDKTILATLTIKDQTIAPLLELLIGHRNPWAVGREAKAGKAVTSPDEERHPSLVVYQALLDAFSSNENAGRLMEALMTSSQRAPVDRLVAYGKFLGELATDPKLATALMQASVSAGDLVHHLLDSLIKRLGPALIPGLNIAKAIYEIGDAAIAAINAVGGLQAAGMAFNETATSAWYEPVTPDLIGNIDWRNYDGFRTLGEIGNTTLPTVPVQTAEGLVPVSLTDGAGVTPSGTRVRLIAEPLTFVSWGGDPTTAVFLEETTPGEFMSETILVNYFVVRDGEVRLSLWGTEYAGFWQDATWEADDTGVVHRWARSLPGSGGGEQPWLHASYTGSMDGGEGIPEDMAVLSVFEEGTAGATPAGSPMWTNEP